MDRIYLSGVSFGISEVDGLWQGVLSDFASDPRSRSVYNCYVVYPQLAVRALKVLKCSSSIATDAGRYTLIYLGEDKAEFPGYHENYLASPASFSSFEVWALIQVAQQAELEFLEVCSTPNNEVQLSGHLIQLLRSKSKTVQAQYNKYLSALGAELNVKKLELQVQNREKITGGDFALLFEWKDHDGKLKICPIVFQAKRSVSIDVDISQENRDSGLQLAVLSKSRCNPSFIFYNCDSKGVVLEPRLPTVKSVGDVVESGLISKTSSVQDSLSLSMFILDIMIGGEYFVTDSRRSALSAILPGVEELELASIVAFSVDPQALLMYQIEYKKYLALKVNPDRGYGSDGP